MSRLSNGRGRDISYFRPLWIGVPNAPADRRHLPTTEVIGVPQAEVAAVHELDADLRRYCSLHLDHAI